MYNILSLDGGGSWAILQLLTLKEKYGNENGHEILNHFDFVIANSGGSIILAALSENWSISKALSLFDDGNMRKAIFSRNSFKERFFPVDYIRLVSSFGPKYSTKRKGEAFRRLFPKIDKLQMSELPEFIGKKSLRLAVSTYDAINNRAKFFRSYKISENENFDSVRLTQAIHGSSNAPVQYFDFPARFKAKQSGIFYELWDGALGGINNPVVAGIIETFKLGIDLNEIKVVSLGNGNKLMSVEDKERFYQVKQITIKERMKKLFLWRLKFQLDYFKLTVLNQAKTILYEPPDWANYVAMMFLIKSKEDVLKDRFIRLSPMIHIDKNAQVDTVELLKKLYQLDMDLTSDTDITLIKECFEYWKSGKIKNQPISFEVTRNNDMICKEGFEYFQDAIDKW